MNRYVSSLKRLNIIYKSGYNIWYIDEDKYKKYRFGCKNIYGVTSNTPSEKYLSNALNKVRGHGFCFSIKINIPDWQKREQYMLLNDIKYKNIPQGHRIYIYGNKIWLCNKSIVVYFQENLSFYGETAQDTLEMAKAEMIRILKRFEKMFNVNIRRRGWYDFKPSRNHFAVLKDLIAKECNEKGDIKVYYDGELFCITDKSFHVGETEFQHQNDGVRDTEAYKETIHNIKDYDKTYGEAPNFIEMRKMFETQMQINQNQNDTITQLNNQIVELTQTVNSLLYKSPDKIDPRDSYFG